MLPRFETLPARVTKNAMTNELKPDDDAAKCATLHAALAVDIAELESGPGEETTVDELMAEVHREVGLDE